MRCIVSRRPNALAARMNPAQALREDYAIPGQLRIREGQYVPLKGVPLVLKKFNARRNSGLPESQVGQHGRKMNSEKIADVLGKMLANNVKLMEKGMPSVPICIWGSHGLGKTTLVRGFADANGWDYAYMAPAQFEEMGDLHGMPMRTQTASGKWVTEYAPPSWAPVGHGRPGILLVDDFNRADDRILRGLMQLFQDGALPGWKLPDNWMIVATANPAGESYSVSELDPAMLTRMLHVEMVFDPEIWIRWAESINRKTGQPNMDPRAVRWMREHGKSIMDKPDFFATHPRTTPRSLDQLFTQLRGIGTRMQDWKNNIDLIQTYTYSAVDKDIANDICTFVMNDSEVIQPEDILFAKDTKAMIERFLGCTYDEAGDERRDVMNMVVDGLIGFITSESHQKEIADNFALAKNNVVELLTHPKFRQEHFEKAFSDITKSNVGKSDSAEYANKRGPDLLLDMKILTRRTRKAQSNPRRPLIRRHRTAW